MALIKVGSYYVTDLKFSILKKYKDLVCSSEYYNVKFKFESKTAKMTEARKEKFAEQCILKCIKMDKVGKQTMNNELRSKAAVVCLAILDSM